MKNKLKIILMASIGLFLLSNCQKDPKLPMPTLQKSVIPLVTKDVAKDQNISIYKLSDFKGTVIVNTYYKDLPKSMTLMVIMNNDVTKSAVLQANITSFPTKVDFDIAKMVTLIPGLTSLSDLQLGDYFRFYVDMILEDGTVIDGNDPKYAQVNSAVANLPGSSITVKYTIACPLDLTKTVGSYRAVCGDWGVDGNVTITADATDPNKLYVTGLETLDGLVEDKGPLPMILNPLTYVVTSPKTILATLVTWGAPYHNIAYEGKGVYNTCTGTFEMKWAITVTEGGFGDFDFILTRND